MFIRIKRIIKTAIMGGLVVLLPSFLLINIAIWLFHLIQQATLPMVVFLSAAIQQPEWVSQLAVLLIILAICVFTGLFIQNRLGAFFVERTESLILNRFPGYQSIKELVGYFLASEKKSLFSQPVLVKPWGNDTWMSAFLVDEEGETVTVFVPTGPNPSTGLVLHTSKANTRPLDASSSEVFKTIIGCGAGSKQFYRAKE